MHIGTGLVVFFAPAFFPRAGSVVAIASLFVLLNIFAYWRGWLKAVHHAARPSFGTVYYPLALLMLASLAWNSHADLVVASIAVMAFGDAAAGIIGETIHQPTLYSVTSDRKSVQGSAAMFVAALFALVAVALVHGDAGLGLYRAVTDWPLATFVGLTAVALFATGWEAASSRGLDNLSVPLMTAVALYLCFSTPMPGGAYLFASGAALGAMVSVAAWRLRLLQKGGAVATFLLATIIYGSGGWMWTLPVFAFFVLSNLLSKWGRRRKRFFNTIFEKSGTRDAGQVAANGALTGALALAAYFFPDPAWYLAMMGAVAAVTADTWGTEIGVLSPHRTVSIRTLSVVEPGTSGGISLAGTLAGIAGAAVVACIGWLFIDMPVWTIAVVTFAGIAGSGADSLLGATAQAQYRCTICGLQTERRIHCGNPASIIQGVAWIGNDAVNIGASLVGAVLALLALSL